MVNFIIKLSKTERRRKCNPWASVVDPILPILRRRGTNKCFQDGHPSYYFMPQLQPSLIKQAHLGKLSCSFQPDRPNDSHKQTHKILPLVNGYPKPH